MPPLLATLFPLFAVLPAAAYGIISLACARSFFRRGTGQGFHPDISILKPVKGMDEGSYENFASFCIQEYPGEWELIFAVADGGDPVVPVIHRLQQDYPALRIELVIDPAIHGPNYKVCNLINGFPRARHDFLIVCDSDIRVPPDYLRSVAAPFADPAVGLVTSLYRTSSPPPGAAALEALGFTAEMVPNVLVALKLEGLSFALGASMAVRREALEKIGGFRALVDYLADDYQLGNKIYRAGYRLELSACWVESMMKTESPAAILSRQLRWARTMRASRPGGWFASVITQPFPGALAGLAAAGFGPAGWSAAALLYAVRLAATTVYSRRYVRDMLLPRLFWLLPLRDFLSFVTWLLSFLGNRVRWRGTVFRLLPGGKIEEIGG